MKKIFKAALSLAFAVITAICLFTFSSSAADGKWITTWSTAPVKTGITGIDSIISQVGDVTTRSIIVPTASGTKLRVKYSNYYGSRDMVISSASVAKSLGASNIDKDSAMPITFGGRYAVTVKPGEEVYSDAIPYEVVAGEAFAISSYIESFTEIKSMGLSGATTYIKMATDKDMVTAESFNILNDWGLDQGIYNFLNSVFSAFLGGSVEQPVSYEYLNIIPCITSVEVLNSNPNAYSVVVIGDSTVANDFPLYLGQTIQQYGITDVGVSGKGVFGGRLLDSGLKENNIVENGLGYNAVLSGEPLVKSLKREILGLDGKNQSNVKYVIVKVGANDIIHPVSTDFTKSGVKQPTAQQLINGYKEVFKFCHDNGIKVIATSITQWDGYTRNSKYNRTAAQFTADWKIATTVNDWLKTTNEHDGYVDLADMSGNPKKPTEFLPGYSIDGFLPSGTLQRDWSDNFPTSLIGVGNRAAGVTLSASSLTVYKGSTGKLTASVLPATAENKKVTWTSSNTKVATVDANGNIKGIANGTAIITVKTVDGGYSGNGYTAKCTVSVKTKPTSVTVKSAASTIYTTKTTKVTATVLPADASYKTVSWSSSDKKVATVDSNGKVTAVGKGTVTITAKSTFDSKILGSCTIKVLKKVSVENVSLNKTSISKYRGSSFTLKATVTPSKASFPELKWSSSNTKIATVDQNGKVTTKKAGKVTITCKSVDNPMCTAKCVVTVKVKTTGVDLKSSSLTMYATQTKTLTAKVLPSDATSKTVTWSSSNTKIATVDKNGKVVAKKPGTVTITVKTKSGGYTDKCKIKVTKYVKSTKVKLDKTSLTLKDGKTYTLKATISPSNVSIKTLKWSSSNKKVAKVDSKGKITAVNPGTCTITAKTKDTGKVVKCTVKVKKVAVKSISFDKKTYTVPNQKTLQLSVDFSPSNATNKNVTWKSSNSKVVKVSSSGKVTGLKAGKSATITATTADGKKVATCKVKVSKVAVKGVKLNKTAAIIGVGDTMSLKATFSPSNASNKKVKWTTSDSKIAKVSSSGVVTPVKDGKAIIACLTEDGGYVAVCALEVKTVKTLGVSLDKSSVLADRGATFYLNASVVPSNASNRSVKWTSTDTTIAKVSSSGKVTTVGQGVCYIRATTASGNYVASCKVTVK